MLTRAIKMAFWIMYDHLGKLMLANLLWSVAIAVPGSVAIAAGWYGDPAIRLWIGLPATVLTLGVILPVMTAGLAHMSKVLIDRKDGAFSDFLEGIRLYWRRASCIGLVYVFAIACLGTSVWFYATTLQGAAPVVGYLISAVAFWCLAFVALTALLVMPALVQKRERAMATIKLAALLVLDNPALTIGVAFQALVISALVAPVWPLFFVLYGSAVLVLASSAYELMARKYAALAFEAGGNAVKPPPDEDDDYLNRGVRDVFFPWKG